MTKPCPPCDTNKVCNPSSGKCVLRTGRIGKKVLGGVPTTPSKNTNTNSNNNRINMITQEPIPRGRKFMLRGAAYDVHGLADLLHHDDHGTVTDFGRRASRVPHIPSEYITAAEKAAIYAKAKSTVPEWTPTARANAESVASRSVPPDLAQAAAAAREARNTAMARQRLVAELARRAAAHHLEGPLNLHPSNTNNSISGHWDMTIIFKYVKRLLNELGRLYDVRFVFSGNRDASPDDREEFVKEAVERFSFNNRYHVISGYANDNHMNLTIFPLVPRWAEELGQFSIPPGGDLSMRVELDPTGLYVVRIEAADVMMAPRDGNLTIANSFRWTSVNPVNFSFAKRLPEFYTREGNGTRTRALDTGMVLSERRYTDFVRIRVNELGGALPAWQEIPTV